MQPRRPFGEYGIGKAQIEAYLIETARKELFRRPSSIPVISWDRVGSREPCGTLQPACLHRCCPRAKSSLYPIGLETVHHGHADDVAQMFMRAIAHWGASVGEAFHAVSPAAITLRGYAEAMAEWFGREPKLRYLPWPQWKSEQSELEVAQTHDHIAHSPNCSIAKAERMLGYGRAWSIEAVCELVNWLIENEIVQV